MLPPYILGAPEKFKSWHPQQWEIVSWAMDSPKRFIMPVIPTGGGKSLIYSMLAHLSGMKSLILTANNGLLNQVISDFEEMGMNEVRGQANYQCEAIKPGGQLHRAFHDLHPATVDHGPCHGGVECDLKDAGCSYFDAVRIARSGRLTATNYGWWLNVGKHAGSGGIAPPEPKLLILDEAHVAPDELGKAVSVQISNSLLGRFADYRCDQWELEEWKIWADFIKKEVESEIEATIHAMHRDPRRSMPELRQLQNMVRSIDRVAKLSDDWIPEVDKEGLTIAPVWPKREAERWLFRGARKVMLTSATAGLEIAERLGIKRYEIDYVEVPSIFPVKNRPIYYIPTAYLSHRAHEGEFKRCVTKTDHIIRNRLDRKGIVHTVSYERARSFTRMTRHRDLIIRPKANSLRSQVGLFKSSNSKRVIISPALSMGWDFPYDDCRYAISLKIAFPDTRSRLMQERTRQDRLYGLEIAAQDTQQASGRHVRMPDDWGEFFILDNNIEWLIKRYRRLFRSWFLDAFQTTHIIPAPPAL